MTSRPRIWFPALHRAEGTHAVWQPIFRKETSVLEARRAQAEPERNLGSGLWLKIDLPDPFGTPVLNWPGDTVRASEFELWTAGTLPSPLEFEAPVL
jgi:hypothetical protein